MSAVVEHVYVLVEEPSMEDALECLLPKILGEISFSVHAHQGKDDLLKKLPSKLAGYAAWIPPKHRIVVIVDRDAEDCRELKKRLDKMSAKARKGIKEAPRRKGFIVINRIAIEELEAWYFGDWQAVREAYPKVSATIPEQAKYRKPDAIGGGTWEAFERVLKRAGYFKEGLRKKEAARSVAAKMVPARNVSPSFIAFRDALTAMAL